MSVCCSGLFLVFHCLNPPHSHMRGAQDALTKCHGRLDLNNKFTSSESGGSEPALEVWVGSASSEGRNDLGFSSPVLSPQDRCAPKFPLFIYWNRGHPNDLI